ncbi:MAG: SPOR domain-containing protein [Imperialibacter sp.]|uniref:SPOR domain-containing protein n=1 Tax=Imperialibacter sp. TaxID=2038411 RepID=UPI003A8837C5
MAKSKANKDKEEQSGSNAPQDDEDFGLPELEYEALDDDEDEAEDESSSETPTEEPSPVFDEPETPSFQEDDSQVSSIFDVEEPSHEEISNVFGGTPPPSFKQQAYQEANEGGDSAKSFTRIIIIGAVAFVLIGFAFLYWHHKDDDKKVVAKATPKVEKAEPKPVEPKPEPVKKEEPVVKKSVNTTGEVVTLTERTGRSYVIVGSFFDGDLADDYGKKLAKEGLNSTVIKPFGKSRFYRVSISDFDTYQEAVDEAEKAKSTYGGEVWALRY